MYIGVDIGGTAVKCGFVDAEGNVLYSVERSVSFDGYRTPIISTVLSAVSNLITYGAENHLAFLPGSAPAEADAEKILLGIGVSATGQIDVHDTVVAGTCGSLPGWEGCNIGNAFREAFHLPVTVANDANCAAYGEVWKGAAVGKRHVIVMTIGTGIGGGILYNGKMLEGKRGIGGEIGHFPIHALNGKLCSCGQRGCLEQYASMTALVAKGKLLNPAFQNGRILFEKAAEGNQDVISTISEWTGEIAAGLIGLVHIFNPELIVIGGGVSAQEHLLIDPLRKMVLGGVMKAFRPGLEIRPALLGNNAGLVGAVYYFLTNND